VLTRAITAVVLILGFIGVLSADSPLPLAIAMTAVVAGAGYEWGRLCGRSPLNAGMFAIVLAGCFALSTRFVAAGESSLFVVAVLVVGSAFWLTVAPLVLANGVAPLGRHLLAGGLPAILPAGIASVYLGPGMFLLTIAIAWVADTFAYLGGRAMGRRKLAPNISPGKTWEGAWCGLASVLIYVWVCTVFGYSAMDVPSGILQWMLLFGAATILFCISVIGDLFESALKRHAGVKDSGKLLPGHGGILDRIDSALALLPIAALMLVAYRQ
jgi:phosphatidate cytidylyltransferase